MILISRKVDYAILVLCELAKPSDARSARGLADRFQLSRPFVANILKELCKHGYVESQRGAKGGYRLAKSPDEVSLAEVIACLEGQFRLMSCSDSQPEDSDQCSLFHICPVKSPLQLVHKKLLTTLRQVTLLDLIEPGIVTSPVFSLEAEKEANGCTSDLSG